MAFIGLLAVDIAIVMLVIFGGIVPIVAGTLLYRKTNRKKLGIALRIIGYVILIPIVLVIGTMVILMIFN